MKMERMATRLVVLYDDSTRIEHRLLTDGDGARGLPMSDHMAQATMQMRAPFILTREGDRRRGDGEYNLLEVVHSYRHGMLRLDEMADKYERESTVEHAIEDGYIVLKRLVDKTGRREWTRLTDITQQMQLGVEANG